MGTNGGKRASLGGYWPFSRRKYTCIYIFPWFKFQILYLIEAHPTSNIPYLTPHTTSHISYLVSRIYSHTSPHTSYLIPHISYLISHISRLISHISKLISQSWNLISHISSLTSYTYKSHVVVRNKQWSTYTFVKSAGGFKSMILGTWLLFDGSLFKSTILIFTTGFGEPGLG